MKTERHFAIKRAPYAILVDTQYNPLHSHVEWEIVLPIIGDVYHTINNQTYYLDPKTDCEILLSKPYDLHVINNYGVYYEHIDIYIEDNTMKELCDLIDPKLYDHIIYSHTRHALSIKKEDYDFIYSLSRRLIDAQKIGATEQAFSIHLTLVCFVTERLSQLYSKSSETIPKGLSDFLEYIHSPDSFDKSMDYFAEYSGFSRSRLSVLFKKHIGTTLTDYHNVIKIDHAKHLLSNKDYSVADTATAVGFLSVSHFVRLFSQYTSISPLAYKKNIQSRQKND